MTTDGAFTPLESLVLVQIIAAHGANGSSFRRIADWIRQTGKTPQTSTAEHSPDESQETQRLQELYINILKTEAKQKLKSSTAVAGEDSKNNGRFSPRKRTPSPKLLTVKDAEEYSYLLPDIVNKLYEQYKEHAISEIREQEKQYDQLVEQVQQLEQRIKDEAARSSQAEQPFEETGVPQPSEDLPEPSHSSIAKPISDDSIPNQSNAKSPLKGEQEQQSQRSRPSTAEARIDSILNHNDEPVNLPTIHYGEQPPKLSTRQDNSPRQRHPSQPGPAQRPTLPPPEPTHLSQTNVRSQQQQPHFTQDQNSSFSANSLRGLDVGSASPPSSKDYGSQQGPSPVHLPPPPGVAPILPPPPGQLRSAELPSQQTTPTLPASPRHLPSPDRNRQPIPDPRHQVPPIISPKNQDPRYTSSTTQLPISRQTPYRNYHQQQQAAQPHGFSHTLPADTYAYPPYVRHSIDSPQVPEHTARQRQEFQTASHRSSFPTVVDTYRPVDAYNYQTPTQRRDGSFAASQSVSTRPEEIVTPGSSTRWKATRSAPAGVVPLDRPRGRSPSPLSDREPSPSTGPLPARNNAQGFTTATRLSTQQTSQSSPKTRGPRGRHLTTISQTPPTRATSSTARTRSQSVASQPTEHTIVATAKGTKTDDDSGTPGAEATDPAEVDGSLTGRRGPRTRKRKFSSVSHEGDVLTLEQTQDSNQHQGMIVATRNFNKMAQPIMHNITTHKHASLFANPVKDRDAEGYTSIIRSPQDLKSIRAAISAGQRAVAAAMSQTPQPSPGGSATAGTITLPYSPDLVPPRGIVNGEQLEQEIMRMLANAVMFNPGEGEDGGIIKDTREMFRTVEQAMESWRQTERLLREGREGDVDSSTVSEEGSSLKRRRVESVDYSKQL